MGILKETEEEEAQQIRQNKGTEARFSLFFSMELSSCLAGAVSQLGQGEYAYPHSLYWPSKTLGFKK